MMTRISFLQLLLLIIGKHAVHSYNTQLHSSRREWIQAAALTPFVATATLASAATGPTDGNLPELPPEAVRSYLQYRIPLQVCNYYQAKAQIFGSSRTVDSHAFSVAYIPLYILDFSRFLYLRIARVAGRYQCLGRSR